MQLTSTETLRLVTGSAVTTDVNTDYEDRGPAGVIAGDTSTAITGATTTTIAGSPTYPYKRFLRQVSIHNKHATSSNVCTVQEYNGTTAFELMKVTLAAGETLQWTEADGWYVLDAAGGRKVAPSAGRLLARTVLVSGTSHTVGMSTSKILVKMVAGGGGGGGCTSVAGSSGAAGGGGGGGYAEKLFTVTPNTAYTCAIGAKGIGVSADAGTTGGDTTFAVGATTVTAKGGVGAPQCAVAATLIAIAGGAGGAVSTNGDLNEAGMNGGAGVTLIMATAIGASGKGGDSRMGAGGLGRVSNGAGNNATGYGAGGGGSQTGASAATTGGDGTAGCIIVEEYA